MISSFEYAAFLIYSPRGQSRVSLESRKVRDRIKRGDAGFLRTATARLEDDWRRGRFPRFFEPGTILVPAPRSAPLTRSALWPAERIARALARAGMGDEVQALLRRTGPVPKAAFAAPGMRPAADDHLRTLEVSETLTPPQRVVVVDDVITRGRMLYARAQRLAEALPGAEIRCFSLLRTMGLIPDVDALIAPCVGTLKLLSGDVQRDP